LNRFSFYRTNKAGKRAASAAYHQKILRGMKKETRKEAETRLSKSGWDIESTPHVYTLNPDGTHTFEVVE